MEAKKKERSANFTKVEIKLLISLVEKYKLIIENKKTDAVTNKEKEHAWQRIAVSFNACGISTSVRSWKTLKLKYEGMKKTTKYKSSVHRQELYGTGGGPSSAPEFTEVDEKLLNICTNIEGLESRHDSDTLAIPSLAGEVVSLDTIQILDTDIYTEEKLLDSEVQDISKYQTNVLR